MSVPHEHNEQLLANALSHGIVALSQSGHLNWWNDQAKTLLGLHTCVPKQTTIDVVFPSVALMTHLKNKTYTQCEVPAPHMPDMILSVTLKPYWDAQCLLVIQDVTRTRRLEMMRRDFIANISHELRTPLTVFHGFLEILLDQPNITPARLRDILSTMNDQCERMETLVEDLLWLSRLESAQPDIAQHQRVAVSSLIKDIVRDAKRLGQNLAHTFHVQVDPDLTLEGDAEELRSAFSNLIYNAVHYTPKGGVITITWQADERGRYFIVEDTGIGIPEKYIDRVTQRFFRVDQARTSTGKSGTGLGLAIVKHVLLRHRGELSIYSVLGQGSRFTCTFAR